jgi:hypothetical protein
MEQIHSRIQDAEIEATGEGDSVQFTLWFLNRWLGLKLDRADAANFAGFLCEELGWVVDVPSPRGEEK